jgi:hypothetical protein
MMLSDLVFNHIGTVAGGDHYFFNTALCELFDYPFKKAFAQKRHERFWDAVGERRSNLGGFFEGQSA